MPQVVDDLRELPTGSHCMSFHASREEAARHAVSFLAGTPEGQPAKYWVPDPGRAAYYQHWLASEAPDHVGCVAILSREQVEPVQGKLRPIEEIREFVGGHPDGVTGCGETITQYWTDATIPDHLEYEAWFEGQPRDASRFLCPYDLRAIPPVKAPDVIRDLGRHHSHVALSRSPEPAVRLLQLFAFPTVDETPAPLERTLRWALEKGLVVVDSLRELSLTEAGERIVRTWSEPGRD
jgi:hypothetical protein